MHVFCLPAENKINCFVIKSYLQVRKELRKYSGKLVKKKEIVVLNKIDLLDKEKISNKTEKLKKVIKGKIHLISTIQKRGIENLKKILINNVYK